MNKRFLSIILALTMILSLAACGDNSGSTAPAAPSGTEQASPAASGTPAATTENAQNTQGSASTETPSTIGETVPEAVPEVADAYEYQPVTEDELTWSYDSATDTLTISGEGPMKDYDYDVPEWDEYYETTKKIVIGDGVTSIGCYAFYGYDVLYEVILPESLEYIGEYAFYNDWALEKLKLPKGLKYIDDRAFYNILIHPDGDFVIPDGVEYIGAEAFHSAVKEGKVIIPASVYYIGRQAFTNMGSGDFVVGPENRYYASVDGVLYDKDVTTLITFPGDNIRNIKVFDVPDTVRTILDESLNAIYNLEEINIPASVEEIETGAIFYNHALTAINVDPANQNYIDVDGVLYDKDIATLICFPEQKPVNGYQIPDSVRTIGKFAFSNFDWLEDIGLPASLEDIEENAFFWTSLSGDLVLPAGVKHVGGLAFSYTSITSLDFGESLETLDSEAVEYCYSLEKVIIPATVKTISRAAFGWYPEDYPELKEIIFEGSEAQWDAIEFTEDDYATWPDDIHITFMN